MNKAGGGSPIGPPFCPPLYIQRSHKVLKLLRENKCLSFIDAGCSTAAIDVDEAALEEASQVVPPNPYMTPVALLHPMHIDFIQGDLTKPPAAHVFTETGMDFDKSGEDHLANEEEEDGKEDEEEGSKNAFTDLMERDHFFASANYDAVVSVEVLEHIYPWDVQRYTDTIFIHLGMKRGARIVILTTPNRDRNVAGAVETPVGDVVREQNDETVMSTAPYAMRHPDHKFEMTGAQFRQYCDYVLNAYNPYWHSYELFGVGDNFTQGAIFYADPSLGVRVNPKEAEMIIPRKLSSLELANDVSFASIKNLFYRHRGHAESAKKQSRPSSTFQGAPIGMTIATTTSSESINSITKTGTTTTTTTTSVGCHSCFLPTLSLVYEKVERVRRFPYMALFGELSEHQRVSNVASVSCLTYRCVATAKTPYRSLWERFQKALMNAFYAAEQETTGYGLKFNRVITRQKHHIRDVLGASCCAVMNCLIQREEACRTEVAQGMKHSKNVRYVLRWILYEYWGEELILKCLKEDDYASAKALLSHNVMRVVLFLSVVEFLSDGAQHLAAVLHSGRWFVSDAPNRRKACAAISSKRNHANGTTKETRTSAPENRTNPVVLPVNRLRLRRLGDALGSLIIPPQHILLE